MFSAAGSPFAVPMLDGQLAVACGPGLQRAVSHRPATFNVDTCAVGGEAPISMQIFCKYNIWLHRFCYFIFIFICLHTVGWASGIYLN